MTRTTDDLEPREPFKPFGEKVTPPPPPAKPQPKGEGPSGIVIGPDGRMRTTTHKPHGW